MNAIMTPFDLHWTFQIVYWVGVVAIGWTLGDILYKITRGR